MRGKPQIPVGTSLPQTGENPLFTGTANWITKVTREDWISRSSAELSGWSGSGVGNAKPAKLCETMKTSSETITKVGKLTDLDAVKWLKSYQKALNPRPEFIAASLRRLVARIRQEISAKVGSKPRPPDRNASSGFRQAR
jgi:hypothetical protein